MIGITDFIQRDWQQHAPAIAPIYKTSTYRGPMRPLISLRTSLAEATGPTFGPQELGPLDGDLIRNYAQSGSRLVNASSFMVVSWLATQGR